MELAIINGTYRDSNTKVAAAAGTVRRTCLIMRALKATSLLHSDTYTWDPRGCADSRKQVLESRASARYALHLCAIEFVSFTCLSEIIDMSRASRE